eukprot:m51a1_g10483 putative d-tyrosyl-trna deacylase-like (170) ;mRNA; r:44045-44873
MRAVVQRVLSGAVSVEGQEVGRIGPGLVCYIGICRDDTPEDADFILRKITGLRLWDNDKNGKKWDQSVVQKNYEILLVSQFTLYATCKGNKPDFHLAMPGDQSLPFFDAFVAQVRSAYRADAVKTGQFGAYMKVDTSVDGPVTIELDSRERKNGESPATSPAPTSPAPQ